MKGGRILLNHYDDIEKVEQLIALGDLSLLGKEIGEKQDFDQPTDRNWSLAYGRDRGEENMNATKFRNIEEYHQENVKQQFNYLYRNGKWECEGEIMCDYINDVAVELNICTTTATSLTTD